MEKQGFLCRQTWRMPDVKIGAIGYSLSNFDSCFKVGAGLGSSVTIDGESPKD